MFFSEMILIENGVFLIVCLFKVLLLFCCLNLVILCLMIEMIFSFFLLVFFCVNIVEWLVVERVV